MYRKLEHLPNLDLLRAIAILMVLILHITANFDVPNLYYYTKIGKYGVELFFCLSGFLVSCLFFNEYSKYGKVNIKKFILRRISRTLPSYYIVLVPAFLSVYYVKNIEFDFHYLFFVQNFLYKIPFFKVSWSICVEEHFYLLLPFILLLLYKFKNRFISTFFVLFLLFIPMALRILESKDVHSFGYYETASYFHFDSMILGVIAGYYYLYKKMFLFKSGIVKLILLLLLLTVFYIAVIDDSKNFFIYGKFFISLIFTLLILLFSTNSQLNISKNNIISKIAVSSYAIYLTHPLIINFYNEILKFSSIAINIYLSMLLLFCIILMLGYSFYFLIEKKLMILRDRYIGR